MSQLMPRDERGSTPQIEGRRDRRWVAELRLRAELDNFAEGAESSRLDVRLTCARRLADVAAVELAFLHEEFSILAGGNAGLEMDLREIEQIFKVGCVRTLHQYMGRR